MLEPESRRPLLEVLSPPPGFKLDRAIGTTFTLDLMALLTAPLGFSLLDARETEGQESISPLALLEATRRHARRITIFTDAGHIAVPKPGQPLLALLEGSVVPVAAPMPGALFHPKVWVIRYVDADGAACVRVLCASRNLTFDRSWDTLLALDGAVGERSVAASEPLARFVESLPTLALDDVSPRSLDDVEVIAADLRRTAFAPPPGFETLAFHPISLDGDARRPVRGRFEPLLIVSPFVTADALRTFVAESDAPPLLIGRPEELDKLPPEALDGFSEVLVLEDASIDEPIEEEDGSRPDPPLGLHAKLYVADQGWNATVWTGSANATGAAFSENVEFLVELGGKRSVCGVNAFLAEGTRGAPGMRDLLTEYAHPGVAQEPEVEEEATTSLIERGRAAVLDAGLSAVVHPDGERYRLELHATEGKPLIPGEVEAFAQPASLGAASSRRLRPGDGTAPIAIYPSLRLSEITSFFAVELRVARDPERSDGFALNVPLEGAPPDRDASILTELLRTRDDLLRFLLMLLAADETAPAARLDELARILALPAAGEAASSDGLALLEPLLQALARDPARVDEVGAVIEEMRASDDGRSRLPDGLDTVWAAIWSARERMEQR